jgi:3-hydroxyisobutyrate dehydrogenase-like beta-hydroxyacid dehydrogenase
VALIRKDLSIALEAAEKVDAKITFSKNAIDYYREIEKKGFGKKDFGFVYQYVHKNFEI